VEKCLRREEGGMERRVEEVRSKKEKEERNNAQNEPQL
jgi:hypothetical protein